MCFCVILGIEPLRGRSARAFNLAKTLGSLTLVENNLLQVTCI